MQGPLTLDSTAPLAGDTFLICPDSQDPAARQWFAGTINWLCNQERISFAKPPGYSEKPTPLLKAWRLCAARGEAEPTRKLTDAERLQKYVDLVSEFVQYAGSDVERIRQWLKYQLCND